jgi:hypothetical protein
MGLPEVIRMTRLVGLSAILGRLRREAAAHRTIESSADGG